MRREALERGPRSAGPDLRLDWGCLAAAAAALLSGAVLIAFAALLGILAGVAIAGVGCFLLAVWMRDRWLLFRAGRDFRRRGILGVLVTSDSPVWSEHIRSRWLPVLGGKLELHNFSSRGFGSRGDIAVRLWRQFAARGLISVERTPVAIVLRGLRDPLVFRFFLAFHEAKQGHPEKLQALEERLFRALGVTPYNRGGGEGTIIDIESRPVGDGGDGGR